MSKRTKVAFADLSPLKQSPAFARLWTSNLLTGLGTEVTWVVVGLQIYAITQDTFAVALVGGLALIPATIAAPLAGMMADAFDRRKVLLWLAIIMVSATVGLFILSLTYAPARISVGTSASPLWELWPYYLCTTLSAMSGVALGATRSSIIPRVVPPSLVAPASALNSLSVGAQVMIGPALAGLLAASVGFAWTFAVDIILSMAAFIGLTRIPAIPPTHGAIRPGFDSLKQSFAFLRTAPQITAGFLADIVAMTFGHPYVLLPAVAAGLVGGGPVTVGVIMSAGAVGTFLTGLLSGPVKHVQRQGLAIGRSIQAYGLFVLLFGVVMLAIVVDLFPHGGASFAEVSVIPLVLACLAFAGMGASDEVSAIFRQSMLLTNVPDEIRGRMQGIFFAVVHAGPRLGDLYVGILASLVALWFPPVLGGLAIVGVMAIILRLTPSLRNYVFRDAVAR